MQMYRKAGKNSRKIWEKRKKVEADVVRNAEGEEVASRGEKRMDRDEANRNGEKLAEGQGKRNGSIESGWVAVTEMPEKQAKKKALCGNRRPSNDCLPYEKR